MSSLAFHHPRTPIRLHKVRLNKGGYDSNGTYWGYAAQRSLTLWKAEDDDCWSEFVRAATRDEAFAKIKQTFPDAELILRTRQS